MSAVLSVCRTYRYKLARNADIFGSKVFAYFCVNPSTADEMIDDQTVKKWLGFTKINDGKEFIVGNLFAYRATDVTELANVDDPVGLDNDKYLAEIIKEADVLVPCWGSREKLPNSLHYRMEEVMDLLTNSRKTVMTFGLTASSDPKHPLMLPYSTVLVPLN